MSENTKIFSTLNQSIEIKKPLISIKDIIQSVNQEELYSRFFGLNVKYDRFFFAQHRKDNMPTATFRWYGDKLRLCDWATGKFYDIFELIGIRYNLGFADCLRLIADEFTIDINTEVNIFQNKPQQIDTIIDIQVMYKWMPEQITYWQQYYFDGLHCKKHNIVAVKNAWINNNHVYGYNKNELCFCYIYADGSKKLYFPNRTKLSKYPRFQGNTRIIAGWDKLPQEGKLVIITKGHKDVACYDLFDIPAISTQGEGIILDLDAIKELENRFDYVIVNLDYDLRGIEAMRKYRDKYNLKLAFYPIGKEAKDFSGYLKLYGINETLDLVNCYKEMI